MLLQKKYFITEYKKVDICTQVLLKKISMQQNMTEKVRSLKREMHTLRKRLHY